MFKTKELAEKNQSQYVETASILNVNETPKGAPKITTSTPVNSRYGIIKKNKQQQQPLSSAIVKQIRPRRYSLSEMSSLQNKSYSNTRTLKSPGPLLAASLDFKDSISMYEETKSSGLAKRIVTYNEEADKFKKITSQEKYNGIGIFPVVNLFASQSPSASLEKSKRLNIQTPRPDFLSQPHSKSQLSKIFEGLTKSPMQKQLSNAQNNNNNNNKDLSNNDTSTKSVLEALREISRKRIHSNVEQDFTEEVGKRQKTEKQNAAETVITLSGKRSRTDSPPLDNGDSSPTQNPTKKKFCVFDEFAASKSSTDYSTLISKPTAIAPKRKTTCTSTEPVVEPKTVKLVNAETQTVIEEEPKEIPTEVVEEKEEITNVHKPRKINYTLKVFDDAPLENMRKSKLAALLGNIMGKELSIPVQTISSTNIIKSIDEADKIVTVDATNNKELNNFGGKTLKATESAVNNLSTTRSDKHVHFSSVNTIISPEAVKTTEPMKQIVIEPPKEQITVSSSPSKGVNLSPSIIVTTNSSTMNLLVKSPPSVTASSATTFNFGQTTNSTALETNSIISPSKTAGGGFKFDLNQAATTTSTNNILSTSSSSSETTTTTTMPSTTGFSFGKPAELKKDVPKSTIPTFSFGATASNKATTIINNKESEISKPQFAFGGSKPEAATTTFGISKSVTSSETPLFSGKSTTTNLVTPTFGNLTTSSAGAAASQIFGAPSNSNNNNNKSTELFGMPKNLPTTTTSNSTVSSPIFGTLNSPSSKFGNSFSTSTTAKFVSSTSSSTFGASKTTVSFGQSPKPSSTCAPFNNIPVVTPKTAAATASPFAAPSTFGAVSASVASTIINAPTTTNSSNHFSFGNNAPSTFGAAASAFGKPPSTTQPSSSSSSSFGQTLAESGVYSFGGNTITSSTSSVPTFGSTNSTLAVTTCSAPVFGNNSFGSGAPVNSAPIFGGGGSSTATSSIAVSPVSSSTMFSTGFNNNGAAQSSSSSSGSFNFTTTTTASSAQFGAFSSTGAATTSSVFGGGGSNVKSGIFKNPSNVFGVAATATNPPPSFGSFGAAPAPSSTTTTMIGSASIFNSGNSAAAFSFGNSASGGLNKPAFGGSSNSFGGGGGFSSTGGFGANNSASAVFGTNTATAKSATGTGGGFGNAASFGTHHQQAVVENKSSFVFGSNNDSSKATSNAGFGSSAGPVSTFGANLIAPGGFDSTGFGQQQQQQPANNSGFNFAANSSSAAFKFGGGSASAPNNNNIISEPQKSFSFSAGANPPAFGSMMNNGNTPQFGASSFNANPSLSVPQQQTAGVFNIGSGSSSRPRPQIRAKRRT